MNRKSFFAALLMAVCFLFAPSLIFAEAETHDGFYLNFQVGGGSGKTVQEGISGGDFEYTGGTSVFKVKAGFAPINNLILYGVYGFSNQDKPDIEQGSATGSALFDISYYDFGGGLCYYFMPVNIYVSADIASTQMRMTQGSLKADSGRGTSFTFSAGKEWWVSENWGLGVALIFSGASITSMGDFNGDKLSHTFYGIAFTATYN